MKNRIVCSLLKLNERVRNIIEHYVFQAYFQPLRCVKVAFKASCPGFRCTSVEVRWYFSKLVVTFNARKEMLKNA